MTSNIIETIQRNLGYPPLKKVDPNIQEVKSQAVTAAILPESFAQAAIPATLTGLYILAHAKDGIRIITSHTSANWMESIFGKHSEAVVERVANYSGADPATAHKEMEKIAAEAVRIANESLSKNATPEEVKQFFVNHRNNILSYLPAALKMGDLLNDDTIDDRTNKMHGPFSDHMHFLEKLFSSSGEAPPNTWTWN